jgi:quinol monooxygenase YgiN
MLTYIIKLRVKPGQGPAYEALLSDVFRQVRDREPGVLYFDFARSVHDPERYVVVEVYRDAEARAAHSTMPWIREALSIGSAMIVGAPEIEEYVNDYGHSLP